MDIKKALHTIQTMIPIEVFKQFCQVLSCINAPISDMLITSILSICTKKEKGFTYRMKTSDNINTITPIREALDLLEGWIITATVTTTAPRVEWRVTAIEKEESKNDD